ncbi:hypothetical protein BUE76_22250 [Cnuella takakiae]|nr:hypothetical protein BUE76_22250 [Cnuella takakiae]
MHKKQIMTNFFIVMVCALDAQLWMGVTKQQCRHCYVQGAAFVVFKWGSQGERKFLFLFQLFEISGCLILGLHTSAHLRSQLAF